MDRRWGRITITVFCREHYVNWVLGIPRRAEFGARQGTAGGITVTNATAPSTSGTTGIWTPSASLVYTTVSIGPVDAVMLYNSTQSNAAIEVITFSAQTPVAATLTLTMPTHAAGTALINLA